MGHPTLKKKSKRLSCRMKYKIDKRVREHNRKKRREARKQRKGGPKKDLIVAPNLCPFKQQMVEELNQAKIQEKDILKHNKMEILEHEKMGTVDENPDPIMKIVQDAQNRARGFSVSDEVEQIASHRKLESITLAKEFKKVVAAADVVLEVVDARDPLGTRCKVVEEAVLQHLGKRLVIVVNKADLVPRDILEKWLTYLRRSWPTVPFKASVQQQSQKLGRRAMIKKSKKKKNLEKLMSVSSSVGAEFLMKLLANYRRNKGIMTSITVGVVGVPNVGKSSVINSLKRSKSCKVGAEPGITRTLQTVQISKSVKILDSPGIVMADPILKNNTILCLKNLVRADKLHDPVQAAQAILVRATKEQMMSLYNVSDYSTPEEFLLSFAKRFGLLGKKGIPDTSKAARVLVQDWNRGKIRFYTFPPEDDVDSYISAEIVTEHTREFALSELETMETNLLSVIGDSTETKHCTYLPISNKDDASPLTELNNVVVNVPTKKKGKLRWRKKSKIEKKENDNVIMTSAKKVQKLAAKKKRKEEARHLTKQINAMDYDMKVLKEEMVIIKNALKEVVESLNEKFARFLEMNALFFIREVCELLRINLTSVNTEFKFNNRILKKLYPKKLFSTKEVTKRFKEFKKLRPRLCEIEENIRKPRNAEGVQNEFESSALNVYQ